MKLEHVKANRRMILKMSMGGAGALISMGAVGALADEACRRTPPQPLGPFYPVDDQLDKDADLTRLDGKSDLPKGQLIYVSGIVTDQFCSPVSNMLVEIWQACASGKYNHPGDSENPAPLDPNFQYWGQALTNIKGEYMFKTIIPGSYPAGDGWIRPPHIHFKLSKKGFHELITQMYFSGEKYNADDEILKRLSLEDQKSVIVDVRENNSHDVDGSDPSAKLCSFNISVNRIRG